MLGVIDIGGGRRLVGSRSGFSLLFPRSGGLEVGIHESCDAVILAGSDTPFRPTELLFLANPGCFSFFSDLCLTPIFLIRYQPLPRRKNRADRTDTSRI